MSGGKEKGFQVPVVQGMPLGVMYHVEKTVVGQVVGCFTGTYNSQYVSPKPTMIPGIQVGNNIFFYHEKVAFLMSGNIPPFVIQYRYVL